MIWLPIWVLSLPAAGFLFGLDRRLTARLQGRIGPPLLQPVWDAGKLLSKPAARPAPRQALWVAAYLAFAGLALACLLAGVDLVLVVLLLGMATASLAVAAFVGPSPFSQLGAQRQLFLGLMVEPVLLLLALGVQRVTGGFTPAGASAPLVWRLPLFLPGLFIALAAAWRKSPFDLASSAHAHQELAAGVTTEMGGRLLGLVELGHWWELALLLALVAWMGYPSPVWAAALPAAFFVAAILMDNLLPRLTWRHLWPVGWIVGLGGGLLNLIWLGMVR
jgi:ech hydrogenase subunit B